MQRRIEHGALESIAAESPKFTAPMVLVHGLWCSAAVWRKFMGYWAHRGWQCHALNLRQPGETTRRGSVGTLRFADYLNRVRRVVAACDAPPVVIGHDLGGLLALCCGPADARATVALAPQVPRSIAPPSNRAFTGLRSRIAMLRAWPLPVPRGRAGVAYFGTGAPGGASADSGAVARELVRDDFRLSAPVGVPALVLAGDRDPVSPSDAVRRLANHCGATFRQVQGAGHALPWEPGWEQRAAEIHRWLIHTLGDPLLALREEEADE